MSDIAVLPGSKALRILAIASAGGHWVQLRRMRPAWDDCEVHYLTTVGEYAADLAPGEHLHTVNDANRWDKFGVARMALKVLWTLARVRPHIVISTGAAPGYFGVRFGKLLGARTIWVDSIANAEELSMTGRIVGRHADLWLTQWPEIAAPAGPLYHGAVV